MDPLAAEPGRRGAEDAWVEEAHSRFDASARRAVAPYRAPAPSEASSPAGGRTPAWLHLGPEPDILAPDLGGWREERYPGDVDDDDPFFVAAPDWVAEILSASTARVDRTQKLPIYARERVPHVWLVDPRDRTVEVFRLGPEGYVLTKTWGGEHEPTELEPFEAVAIPPSAFWGKRRAR